MAKTQSIVGGESYRARVLRDNPVAYYRLDDLEGYAQAVLSDGPAAYWRLGETAGTTATDATGNGRTGTYSGTYTQNQAGAVADGNRSTHFTASGSRVTVADNASINLNGTTFSIECWIQLDDLSNIYAFLDKNAAGTEGWRFIHAGAGSVWLQIKNAGSFITGAGNGLVTVTAGSFYHLVYTYDGTNGRIYVNGQLQQTKTHAAPANTNTASLLIGGGSFVNEGTQGDLQDVAIYRYALGAQQIANHYALRTSTIATVAAATVADLSGNGFTGTIGGGVTLQQAANLADGDKASSFDGVTGVITIADAPAQNPGLGSFSYEAWIKRAAGIAASEFIVCKASGAGVATGGGELFLSATGVFTSRLNTTITVASAAGFADGQWHHVVVSMNRTTNLGQMYVDGVASGAAVDLSAAAAINLSGSGLPLLIGKRPTGNFFTGQIDEVAAYGYALTAEQAAAHYGNRLAVTSGLRAGGTAIGPRKAHRHRHRGRARQRRRDTRHASGRSPALAACASAAPRRRSARSRTARGRPRAFSSSALSCGSSRSLPSSALWRFHLKPA
jgi:hypothetical protein